MQAIISGQAGVALLVDGERLSSIHVDQPSEVLHRKALDIPFLFAGATDLQFMEVGDAPEAAQQLEVATVSADALHLVLIVLDSKLASVIREEAAIELADLIAVAEASEWLESVLYSCPLPEQADLSGALSYCKEQCEGVRDLLLRLDELQREIIEISHAWEQIASDVF